MASPLGFSLGLGGALSCALRIGDEGDGASTASVSRAAGDCEGGGGVDGGGVTVLTTEWGGGCGLLRGTWGLARTLMPS